ncbi:MAG: DNA polymerase III subunit beta [Anaerolineae bacterium]|nr:DNA polymerase III subunit beta [Anaerolineae bacterium]
MKVSVLQENLAKGLSIVGRSVPNRPTMQVLGNVLLETEEGRLKLAATNLELGITAWIGAKIEEDGAITVPARTFIDLVNQLSPERVDLDLDVRNQTLKIHCGATNSNIKGIDANEFPLIPQAGDDPGIAVPGATIREMINQVVFSAATDDNRPILTGVYTRITSDEMIMAAADGYRLSVRKTPLELGTSQPTELIIPARTLAELSRIISDEDEEVLISIPQGRNQVIFHLKNVDVASTLLDGKFPDYNAIIPKSHSASTVAYTADLLRACKRADIFARDVNNNAKVIITPADTPSAPGMVRLSATSNERGNADAIVDATVDGDEQEISFNVRYLIDVLNVIKEEQVLLQSNGPTAPGVIKPVGREDFVHVIMPMSVGR